MYALRLGLRFLGIKAECNLHDLNNLDLRRAPLLAPFVLQQHLRFDCEPECIYRNRQGIDRHFAASDIAADIC
jgi:hypothetical protein